jgi:hypothetical protein
MVERYPNSWKLEHLLQHCVSGNEQAGLPDGRRVPARPMGFCSLGNRIRCAWLVFTGRADAVEWPGQ